MHKSILFQFVNEGPVDEIDANGKENGDEPVEQKLSIQESSVPWRLSNMDVKPSERASEDPHDEFGNQVPASDELDQGEAAANGQAEVQKDGEEPQPDEEEDQSGIEVKITLGDDSDDEQVRLLGESDEQQTTV